MVFGGWFLFWQSSEKLVSPLPEPPPYFTLVVLPDTQLYSQKYPDLFFGQTAWVVRKKFEENIVFVSHVGDITQTKNNKKEWENADRALSLLDAHVPYGLLPGNHDDPVVFNRYFPPERFRGYSWYGGHYGEDNSNSYQFFTAHKMNFIVLHLQMEPPAAVIEWADEVLGRYPDHRAIVSTHYFLDYDGFRSPIGEKIYRALADNPNLFLILCGHIHLENRRQDTVAGRPVYQLLADYQTRENGGDGWLRLLKFVPEQDKIYVRTYSPWLDEFETDENSQFELEYEMVESL